MKTHKIDNFLAKRTGIASLCGKIFVEMATHSWDIVDCKLCLRLRNKEQEIYDARKKQLETISKKGK